MKEFIRNIVRGEGRRPNQELADRLVEPLNRYLELDYPGREKVGVEERASMLGSALTGFARLNYLKDRERVLPSFQRFVMSVIRPGEGESVPVPTIDEEVMKLLADKEGSEKMRHALSHLGELRYYTNEADVLDQNRRGYDIHDAELFKGTGVFVKLGLDGSVAGYAANTEDGGLAHTSLGGVERYALMKALFGLHLALEHTKIWPKVKALMGLHSTYWQGGTNVWANYAYGRYVVGLDHMYVGNGGKNGLIGVSGAEMYHRWIIDQGGNIVPIELNEESEYWGAGVADDEAADRIDEIMGNMENRRRPTRRYHLLPERINLKAGH